MAGKKLTVRERLARLAGMQKKRGEEFSGKSPVVETAPKPPEAEQPKPPVAEPKAEEVEKRKMLVGTVPRVALGHLFVPSAHECGDPEVIVGWGKRPAGSKGGLRLVSSVESTQDSRFYSEVIAAEGQLRKHALPIEDGPFADKDGEVERLAKEISKGAEGPMDLMDRAIDVFRPFTSVGAEMGVPRVHQSPSVQFMLNQEYSRVPDKLPRAGEILSQKAERTTTEKTTGAEMFLLSHYSEAFVLAAAALRMCGVNAHPSLAAVPHQDGEMYSNIITVVHLDKEAPITTFGLVRPHPPMGAIDILSDTAVMGLLHVLQAETRIKHLTTKMAELSKVGEVLNEDQIAVELKRIAEMLFECHLAWNGSHFISDALSYLGQDVYDAMIASQRGNLHRILEEQPELAANPMLLEAGIERNASSAATIFTDNTRRYLSMLISTMSEFESD